MSRDADHLKYGVQSPITSETRPEPLASGVTSVDVLEVARMVARRYARRVWWADMEDLASEATRAAVEAARTWDPEVGVPFVGYAQRAAAKALSTYLWRQSAPVTAPKAELRELAGVHRAEYTEDDHESEAREVGARIDEVRWRERVRQRIEEIASRTKDGHLARAVLLDGLQPSQVDIDDVRYVYRAVELVRRKIAKDQELYDLWQEVDS